ncbi:MAG: TIGR01620 family protein [Pseudomonadota bacterium]
MSARDDDGHQGPVIFEVDGEALPPAPAPAEAPPVEDLPRAGDSAAAAALARAARRGRGRGGRASSASRLLLWALGGLVLLWFGTEMDAFLTDLFARAAALGWVGTALFGLLGLALLAMALRELSGIARLGRIERMRADAARALAETTPEPEARAAGTDALVALVKLYRNRPELADAVAQLQAARGDMPAPRERIHYAEKVVLAPLDARAAKVVERGAREVAAATAIVPVPVLDIALVLWANLRMLRRVAEVYGGRSGWLGSWRLLKAVATHLVATGAISATDDLLGPFLGHGIVGRLSRRFGEAAVNAALTARVGTAAIAVCRPLAFEVETAPRARNLLFGAIGDWRGRPRESGGTEARGDG